MDDIRKDLGLHMFGPGCIDFQEYMNHKARSCTKVITNDEGDENVEENSFDFFNNTKRQNKNDLEEVTCFLDWRHSLLGIDNKKSFQDVAFFQDENGIRLGDSKNDFVFKNVPMKSRLFEYIIRFYPIKDVKSAIAGSNKHMYCQEVDMKPIPLNRKFIQIMFEILAVKDNDDINHFYINGEWINDPMWRSMANSRDIDEYIYKRDDVLKSLTSTLDEFTGARLAMNPELKLYFMHDYLEVLFRYYSRDFMMELSWEDITNLYKTLKSTPHILCFSKTNTFRHKVPSKFQAICDTSFISDKDGTIPLSELTWDAFVDAYDELDGDNVKVWNFASCVIYELLKRSTHGEKHAYVKKSEILRSTLDYPSVEICEKDVEEALKWLQENSIIVIDKSNNNTAEDKIFIESIYTAEKCIAKSIEYIFAKSLHAQMEAEASLDDENGQTDQNNNTDFINLKSIQLSNLKSHNGFKLCSEQVRAFSILAERPILIVDGPGGSGKEKYDVVN